MLGTFGKIGAAKEKHVKKHFCWSFTPADWCAKLRLGNPLSTRSLYLSIWKAELMVHAKGECRRHLKRSFNTSKRPPSTRIPFFNSSYGHWRLETFGLQNAFCLCFAEFGETVAKEGNAQNKLIFGLLLSKQLPNFQSTSCSSLWPNLPFFGSKMLTVKRPSIMFGDSQIDKFGKAAKAFVKETEVGQLAPICSPRKKYISACQFHGKSMQILYCLF